MSASLHLHHKECGRSAEKWKRYNVSSQLATTSNSCDEDRSKNIIIAKTQLVKSIQLLKKKNTDNIKNKVSCVHELNKV